MSQWRVQVWFNTFKVREVVVSARTKEQAIAKVLPSFCKGHYATAAKFYNKSSR